MVHKIAIGLAAAAIVMAGATSGTLAQGPAGGGPSAQGPAGGEAGAKAGAPAHGAAGGGEQKAEHKAEQKTPHEAMGKAEQKTPHEAMGKAEQKTPREAMGKASEGKTGLTPGEVKKEERRDEVIDRMPNRDARNDARQDAIKSIPGRVNRQEALRDEKKIEQIPGRANRQEARVEAREDRVMRHEFHVTHHGAREPAREERGRGGVNIHLGGHPGFGPSHQAFVGPSVHRQVVEHRYSFGGPAVRRGLGRPGVRTGAGYNQRVRIKTSRGAYGKQKIKIKISH